MVKPFLVLLVVLLPHTIFCESVSSTDSDKYLQQLTPSQSLYCNDLNPQSHLDFNMVKILSDDSEISTAAKKSFHQLRISSRFLLTLMIQLIEFKGMTQQEVVNQGFKCDLIHRG